MSVAFPTILAPGEVAWKLRGRTQTQTSPLDGTTQTLALPGARWEASLSWPAMTRDDSRVLEAFFALMRGMQGRFFYGPTHAPRRATGGGSPVINGANQSGATLSIRGFTNSSQAFRVGDWLSYTDSTGRVRLHQVTADVNANGSGVAAVPIAPPIRRAGADGAAVNVTAPVGVFMLADDGVGEIRVRPPLLGSASLQIVEALV